MPPVNSPCIEWERYRNREGYGRIHLPSGVVGAHRVAYCEAHGLTLDDIKGQIVRHKCDNPPCVNPDHLELGTHADNHRDMIERERGGFIPGNKHCNAKLTEADVREIRKVHKPRCRANGGSALARKYGVSQQLVSRIVNGKIWTHLEEDSS